MYLADFNKSKGIISYSVENEKGDRIDKASTNIINLKDLDIVNMDLFLLSYLPKLMSKGNNIKIMGPISANLSNSIDNMQLTLIRSGIHPFAASTIHIVSLTEECVIEYDKQDIIVFAEEYLKNNNLDNVLKKVFNYYI